MYAGRGLNIGCSAMIGSRRVHFHVAIVSIEDRAHSKEDSHEKEVQEEGEAHVKKCNARKVGSVSACRAKSIKKSGP
jgi:hypothetical protein